MTIETAIILTNLKTQLETTISEIEGRNKQIIYSYNSGMIEAYRTVVSYIDAVLEESNEKK